MKKLSFFLFLFIVLDVSGQNSVARPKLVIGVLVDQMRWDYLYRYNNRFGNDGLRRILKEGFSCENTFIPYVPTVTAIGHTSVYTGSVPSLHGIMGNDWYSKELGRNLYCTEDDSAQTVGSSSSAGKMSPKNLWSNTITDELRMATNFQNKTIAIALKDRGSILPGGHTANGAYWFDNASGGWVSSTFYMDALPGWVEKFNERKLPDSFLKKNWNTLYPTATYKQSTADDKPYEGRLAGGGNTFPHITDSITRNKYELFRNTPYGNTYTFEMAKAAIEAEGLGKRAVTDFLAVSFSTPDYIGHTFGPNSIEVEDNYLRFDKEMGAFLTYLDARIGKGQYVLFLTADHAVAHVPAFMEEHKMPGKSLTGIPFTKLLNDSIHKRFDVADVVSAVGNYQVYFNDKIISKHKLDKKLLEQFVCDQLLGMEGIAKAFPLAQASVVPLPEKVRTMAVNGYNQKRSGDIIFMMKPQWFTGGRTGTTHGSWNPYDAHIPLLWFGWGIKSGKSNREVYMTDIAPTLAALLHIQMPNASIGDVIEEVMK